MKFLTSTPLRSATALVSMMLLTLSVSSTALAAPTPEACFTASGNTVTGYTVNVGLGCTTDVEIPSTIGGNTITAVGVGAFATKGLTSIVMANTITTIDNSSFYNNNLTSVTLSNSLLLLSDNAFSFNNLTDIAVPDSVILVSPIAFLAQTDDTAAAWANYIAAAGGDTAAGQALIDAVYYPRLYTVTPSNPNSLPDRQVTETAIGLDLNGDGDMNDVIGGSLMNPAEAIVTYEDGGGNTLLTSTRHTGDGLTSYQAAENSTNDLNLYYRLGDSVDFTAPAVSGYSIITPTSPYSAVLGASTNIEFVYSNPPAPSPSNPASGGLANTGIGMAVPAIVAFALIAGGGAVLVRRRV